MARTLSPTVHEGELTFVSNSAEEQFTWWPVLLDGDAQIVTPTVPIVAADVKTGSGKGYLRSVRIEIPTGGDLTLADFQVIIVRDLKEYPDDTDGFTLSGIRDGKKVYVSDLIASPTPDDVTAVIDDRLAEPEPFNDGLWIGVVTGSSTGTPGSTTVKYTIYIDAVV